MGTGNIEHKVSNSPIGDVSFLSRSEHRIPALMALTDRPRTRSELCELTDVSASTIRRTLSEFENREWIRKEGYRYTATRLGAVIVTGMTDLLDRVETERNIRPIWQWLPDELRDLPVETWATMTVSIADPDAPYQPVNRFKRLLRDPNELRFVRPDIAMMEPCFDILQQLIETGVDIVVIDRPQSHSYFLSTYPTRSAEMLRAENFTVLEHDELPAWGIGLIDDRVVFSCYEQENGTVHALLDTTDAAVRSWVESAFETYAETAHGLEAPPIEAG